MPLDKFMRGLYASPKKEECKLEVEEGTKEEKEKEVEGTVSRVEKVLENANQRTVLSWKRHHGIIETNERGFEDIKGKERWQSVNRSLRKYDRQSEEWQKGLEKVDYLMKEKRNTLELRIRRKVSFNHPYNQRSLARARCFGVFV